MGTERTSFEILFGKLESVTMKAAEVITGTGSRILADAMEIIPSSSTTTPYPPQAEMSPYTSMDPGQRYGSAIIPEPGQHGSLLATRYPGSSRRRPVPM